MPVLGDTSAAASSPTARGLLQLTERAAEVASRVQREEGLEDQVLRAAIAGGGCSGFRFDLYFDDEARPGDVRLTSRGVTLAIDMMSAVYLDGATIDYVQGLHGAGFRFELPSASSTCGGCAASGG
ncbi:MAG: iron-sulfur cluster assembly accessory protein [Sandaracinaceae bacterium]|nr:iron-sulfur cluster assembly accessory protein [Sandaracinaceae bacterium]